MTFLTLNCSNFSVKGLKVNKNLKKSYVCRGFAQVRIRKTFSETITHKIFETNFSFHVE